MGCRYVWPKPDLLLPVALGAVNVAAGNWAVWQGHRQVITPLGRMHAQAGTGMPTHENLGSGPNCTGRQGCPRRWGRAGVSQNEEAKGKGLGIE